MINKVKSILKLDVFTNIIWLFFDKFFGAILTLYIYSRLAVYFGKELFGVWNYILSFSSIIVALGGLGLNFVIVRRLKKNPNLSKRIIKNVFYIRLISGLVAALLTFFVYAIVDLNFETKYTYSIIFIFLSQAIVNANVFIFWNEAYLNNKWTVINRNAALLISFFLRIYGIYSHKDITYFALINLFEVLAFLFLTNYFPKTIIKNRLSKPKKTIIVPIIKEGFPLMLSAVVVILYLRIDQVIIGYLLGNKEIAIYSPAAKITEMLYAAPVIISNVYFPKLVELFHKKTPITKTLKKLFFITTSTSILIIIIVGFFSENIIELLFGAEYQKSSSILKIYIWSILFMSLLVTSSKYLLTIKCGVIILKRDLIGLFLNIILNFALIPIFGVKGAAYATLISYFMSSYGANIFFKELRPIMKYQAFSVFYSLKKQ